MLISFNMASNKPSNFNQFCENLETTVGDASCLEVLVLIDEGDAEMRSAVKIEQQKRSFEIKFLLWPAKGYFHLWQGLNQLHNMCNPKAYFVCNINDEIRFKTKNWDKILKKYIGFFPDHIFRLCTSVSKFRNYSDFWECGYAPENYPIATKRWIDIQGDWGACHGPDAFQQFVSFYLCRSNAPEKEQYCRDVPILDIKLDGEGAYVGMKEKAMWARVRKGWKSWRKITSYGMQLEASRRANLLYLHIMVKELDGEGVSIQQSKLTRRLMVRDADSRRVLMLKSYAISRIKIVSRNLIRRPNKYRHCGGNPPPFRHSTIGNVVHKIFQIENG